MTTLDLDLDLRDIEELTADVKEFQARRDYVLGAAQLPSGSMEDLVSDVDELNLSIGTPPFVVWNGIDTFYAVILENGDARPLPYGYELDPDDLNKQSNASWSHLAFGGSYCYKSLRSDFELPDDDEFELERSCNEWEASKYAQDGSNYVNNRWFDAETNEPYTGVATAKWPNGKLKMKAHLTDGILDGKMTWWRESGQKKLEDDYKDNQRHGKHRAWHENGQLAKECGYKDGLAHGKHETWHANGNRALLRTFEGDEEQGINKEWYESGQLGAVFPMVDGKVHGTVQLWDEDGTKKEDIEFFEGERVDSAEDEVTSEEVEDLKERIMELIESEESKAEALRLIEIMEDRADGDLGQIAEGLRGVVDQLKTALETAHFDIDAKAPLVNATVEGDVKEIRRLLKEGPEPDVGPPGFVYAIVADQPKAFEVYVKHGIDVSKQFDWDNGDGSTIPDVNAFILAAGSGSMWAVKRLLNLGADPNLETGGQTPLRMAITNGQDEVVDLLFDKIPDVSHSSAGRVLVAAARAENTELVERCLEAGIPANATDAYGWTALKCAVRDLDNEMVELLLQHGADRNIADDEGWTPLLNAIENRDLDMVNLLLSNGANPNAAPDVEDDDGNSGFSALMRAAHYGEPEILEALIGAGADVAQTDSDGAAAIHYAAAHRLPNCLKILLDHGADPNKVGFDGHSPVGMLLVGLGAAVQEGAEIDQAEAIKTLKLLIKNGADWHEGAGKVVASVGDMQVTVLDGAKLAMKQEGLNKLSKEFDRLSS